MTTVTMDISISENSLLAMITKAGTTVSISKLMIAQAETIAPLTTVSHLLPARTGLEVFSLLSFFSFSLRARVYGDN